MPSSWMPVARAFPYIPAQILASILSTAVSSAVIMMVAVTVPRIAANDLTDEQATSMVRAHLEYVVLLAVLCGLLAAVAAILMTRGLASRSILQVVSIAWATALPFALVLSVLMFSGLPLWSHPLIAVAIAAASGTASGLLLAMHLRAKPATSAPPAGQGRQ